jgi:hypothetical protein
MAEPSLERAMKVATMLNQIGFVEFTTDLVKNVYNVIIQATMDQLKQYAEFVKDVSKSVSQYQIDLGLGNSDDPSNTTNASLLANCEKYAVEVLGLTKIDAVSGTPAKYKIDSANNEELVDKRNAIISNLQGIDSTPAVSTTGTADVVIQPPGATATSLEIVKSDLDNIIAIKLRKGAEESYNLLKTILKIGVAKIVLNKGFIGTKLTFHVDASETASVATSDVNIKSRSFSLGGGISGGFKKIGGSLAGGMSNSNLKVTVVNEKSSAVANMAIDIVGEVRLEFSTDYFPSING